MASPSSVHGRGEAAWPKEGQVLLQPDAKPAQIQLDQTDDAVTRFRHHP
jgi:hypothetical protein